MDPVDQIKNIYKLLFSVKFLHNGYAALNRNFISDSIYIKPDKETEQLFADQNLGYRFYTDLLLCFIQCDIVPALPDDPKKIPHINFINEDVRIRFLVNASTAFLKNTTITVAGAKQVYQFSNQSNANVNMILSSHEEGVNDDDLKDISLVETDEPCLAVLDIHTGNAISDEYALLDPDRRLVDNPPEYNIRFKSTI